jgi:hypothetical protein
MPNVPSFPLTKLCQSQQIADLGILDNKIYPVDSPARNTRSQTQVHTITQVAVLGGIHNYGKATNHPVTARHTALWQYPSDMLHAVLDKTMGHLMEMQHLLVNPKYKELWGKSYTKELGCLAQGIPGFSKGINTIIFVCRKDIPHDRKRNVMYARVCVNYCSEKRGPQPHMSHCGRQSPPLPRQLQHTYCQHDHCQAPSQQRHLNKERMLLHH